MIDRGGATSNRTLNRLEHRSVEQTAAGDTQRTRDDVLAAV
jgi:hypothetical protein